MNWCPELVAYVGNEIVFLLMQCLQRIACHDLAGNILSDHSDAHQFIFHIQYRIERGQYPCLAVVFMYTLIRSGKCLAFNQLLPESTVSVNELILKQELIIFTYQLIRLVAQQMLHKIIGAEYRSIGKKLDDCIGFGNSGKEVIVRCFL
ncbi:hypothetical protein D3C86_1345110 [compost metagenome]